MAYPMYSYTQRFLGTPRYWFLLRFSFLTLVDLLPKRQQRYEIAFQNVQKLFIVTQLTRKSHQEIKLVCQEPGPRKVQMPCHGHLRVNSHDLTCLHFRKAPGSWRETRWRLRDQMRNFHNNLIRGGGASIRPETAGLETRGQPWGTVRRSNNQEWEPELGGQKRGTWLPALSLEISRLSSPSFEMKITWGFMLNPNSFEL